MHRLGANFNDYDRDTSHWKGYKSRLDYEKLKKTKRFITIKLHNFLKLIVWFRAWTWCLGILFAAVKSCFWVILRRGLTNCKYGVWIFLNFCCLLIQKRTIITWLFDYILSYTLS
ncbi:unnamed protein product [Blepharisma stoltei]|uniref:Uncharacterized protein n=1 Tax=Blepharisma stoltei TaxID=1481888 RepID=A0AAU9JD53_9CILI|nr:unnamed protein product [Blepharisma stoltei]